MSVAIKGSVRNPCDVGSVLYFACININIPAVIRNIVLQDATVGKNWVRLHGISHYLLQLHVNLYVPQKKGQPTSQNLI